jgi:hypothetical protein
MVILPTAGTARVTLPYDVDLDQAEVFVTNTQGNWPRETRSPMYDVVGGNSGNQWIDWSWSYVNPITGVAGTVNFDGSGTTTKLHAWVSYELTVNPVDEENLYVGNGEQDPLLLVFQRGYKVAQSRVFDPAWNWFGIPLVPAWSAEAVDVLGFTPATLVRWNGVTKTFELYPDDWRNLEPGVGYLMYLAGVQQFGYIGSDPASWSVVVPERGSHYIGLPQLAPVFQGDVLLINNNTGERRTIAQDAASASPWLNPNWVFFRDRTYQTLYFGGGSDDTMVRPFQAYYIWAFEPNITIVFQP